MRGVHVWPWVLSMGLLGPWGARADVEHVVAPGHTLEAIAHRYHVSPKAIASANHLKDPAHLKVGTTLVIPGVKSDKSKKDAKRDARKPATYAMRPKTPGVVHATRLSTSEDFVIRVGDGRGRVPKASLDRFQRMMRSVGNQTHDVDARLVSLVAVVSNHFGGRKLEVISGFRPKTATQYTPHSNHNVGKAMDFRVVGVPNEVLRDFCRTLKNVGVGYYPNSTFVHLDVRSAPAYWIDYSRPGEKPRYDRPNADADEGTSDVSEGAGKIPDKAPDDKAAPDAPEPAEAPKRDMEPNAATPRGGDAPVTNVTVSAARASTREASP